MPRGQSGLVSASPRDTPAPPGAAAPCSPEQLAALRDATERARTIRNAARLATFNAWTIGIFAAPALLIGLFSLPSFIIGAGLAVVTFNEYRGAQRLRRFDRYAPRMLGWNQVGLATGLVIYGAVGLYNALAGPGYYAEQIAQMPSLAATLEPLGRLYSFIAVITYSGVIGGSLIFQGLNAWYYFTREKHIRDYLVRTPPWVVQVQRAAA